MTKSPWCEVCPLFKEAGPVLSSGPATCAMAFIGEAPGNEETKTGAPFTGGSGRVLTRIAASAGINRYDCFITNVVKCRPPNNRTPTPAEIAQCIHNPDRINGKPVGLLQELSELKCRTIIPLGAVALQSVAAKRGIESWRGSILNGKNCFIVPTLHPAAVMRTPEFIPVSVADLRRAHSTCSREFPHNVLEEYKLYPTTHEVANFFDKPPKILVADIETTGIGDESLDLLRAKVTIIGVADLDNPHRVCVIPFTESYLSWIRDWHRDPNIIKVYQNAAFDVPVLHMKDVPTAGPIWDTAVMCSLLSSDLPNSLEFIGSTYTEIPYWKDQSRSRLEWYNARDVHGTAMGAINMAKDLREEGMWDLFEKHSTPALRTCINMQIRGVKFDPERIVRVAAALDWRIGQLESQLRSETGDPWFNWRSHQQIRDLLYTKLKLPKKTNKKGKITTDKNALQELADETGHPMVGLLQELGQLGKLQSTYFQLRTSPDGRAHPTFSIHTTANGRLSCSGPNLQNVPEGPARAVYIPDEPDWVFIEADYSQIEYRILAQLSGDPTMIQMFASGYDFHSATWAEMTGCSIDAVSKEQRHIAKMLNYGTLYGRGAASIAHQMRKTVAEVKAWLARYYARFPRVAAFMAWVTDKAEREGVLINPFGRRRYFYGGSVRTKALNFLPSSSAADIIIRAMPKIDLDLPRPAELLIQVHDSLVVQTPIELASQVIDCIKTHMMAPVPELDNLVIPIDIKVGPDWGSTRRLE